jgi:hypothetical protein
MIISVVKDITSSIKMASIINIPIITGIINIPIITSIYKRYNDTIFLFAFFNNLVNQTKFNRFLGRHVIVALHDPFNLVEWLSGMRCNDLI